MHEIWDVDLLVGRDVEMDLHVDREALEGWGAQTGLVGGWLGSLRALLFDVTSGNAEAKAVAQTVGLTPTLALDTRDWPGTRDALRRADTNTVVRLAPERQGCQPGYPGFAALLNVLADRDCLVLTEGDLRVWGPAYKGRGLRVVFLDAHFFHLGDFIALAEREPDFVASTRLLNGPDSFEMVRREVGIERLVFGSRSGIHEGAAALSTVLSSELSEADRAAVLGGTARRLMTRGSSR